MKKPLFYLYFYVITFLMSKNKITTQKVIILLESKYAKFVKNSTIMQVSNA